MFLSAPLLLAHSQAASTTIPLNLATRATQRQTIVAEALYAQMRRSRFPLDLPQEGFETASDGTVTLVNSGKVEKIESIDMTNIDPHGTPLLLHSFPNGFVTFWGESLLPKGASLSELDERFGSPRFSRENLEARQISDGQATEAASRIFRAAGYGGEILPFQMRDGQGNRKIDVMVMFVPAWRNVPYALQYQGYVYVDRLTGRVHEFSAPTSIPSPPSDLRVALSSNEARVSACRSAATRFGGEFVEYSGLDSGLRIWSPAPEPRPGRTSEVWLLDSEDVSRARRQEGRLVYVTSVAHPSDLGPPEGKLPQSLRRVYTDAATGRILQID